MKKTIACLLILLNVSLYAQDLDLGTFKWRSIGPSFMSGRIIDLAVDPVDPSTYYVGVASGGVFKTSNGGTTYEPIFEQYGSYSIGSITIDPHNKNVIWVGTGEANNQRSVAYGDGIYKSEDGGKSFANMGLKTSEHIGKIIVDPKNPLIVWVAAYGPLWNSGGERGVYKSLDGGKTWKQVLNISEHTGVADIVMDPRDPNTLYASAHQRQRKVHSYVSGGPESGLYKTTDGGATWNKTNKGLPSADKGRIAIAISPINPDVLYCHLEAQDGQDGTYKSSDRGASWSKMSSYSTIGLYYSKIFPDPVQFDKYYVGDVFPKYTNDGGKTFVDMPIKNVHVDDHVIWIDPNNNKHWMMGGDGGLYETYNEGQNWNFKQNLSITQFYRVALDNAFPFYNVFGGTQDNNSMGGPSMTANSAGIPNSEWYITQGGDGFESQVDWQNPDIIYAQAQHGWLSRYDKKTGERVAIKPIEMEGEGALRWNWDSPLVVSSHDSKRLYFGANKVYKSDDRGNSWSLISPDLSRGIDRNTLPLMGKVWSVDAVMKNTSTSIFGQTTTIAESPLDQNILYVGTDDGLIQITSDGGKNWKKIDNLPGVPKMSYIPQITCSKHDKNTAYVVFNHHKYGDYAPYLLKTKDGGNTWSMIVGNLPVKGSLYTVAEDHMDPNLLFAGSEFGAFVSVNGGTKWQQIKNGLPVICVKDMEIQQREHDLVIATFGRGFYVLDNYSNLRQLSKDLGKKEDKIYPIKTAWMYNEASPLGGGGRNKFGSQGDSYWAGENPEKGVHIRYSVNQVPSSMKSKRKEKEKEQIEKGTLKGYPSTDSFWHEDNELMPYYFLSISDESGNVIKRIKQNPKVGLNKFVWDMTTNNLTSLNTQNNTGANNGLPVSPGKYSASLHYFDGQDLKPIGNKENFEIQSLGWATLPAKDITQLKTFGKDAAEFAKVVYGTDEHVNWLEQKHKSLKAAAMALPKTDSKVFGQLNEIEKQFQEVKLVMNGNQSLERRNFEALPGLKDRLSTALWSIYGHSSDVPNTQVQSLAYAKKLFLPIYDKVKGMEQKINEIQSSLSNIGAPYIQGSLPVWNKN